MLNVLRQCAKELDDWPEGVRGELADVVARLERGHELAMPLSRPMPSIGAGVHELRFRDRGGIYRCVYWLAGAGTIWLLHAFKKKGRKTPMQNLETARERLKRVKT